MIRLVIKWIVRADSCRHRVLYWKGAFLCNIGINLTLCNKLLSKGRWMPESVKYRPSKVNLRRVKPMDLDGYGERPIDNALDFMVWRTHVIWEYRPCTRTRSLWWRGV